MKILFFTTHSHLPQKKGGSQSSTDELAKRLSLRGHTVAVLCGLESWGKTGVINRIKQKLSGRSAPPDKYNGYVVFRTWNLNKATDEVIAEFKPDCIICQAGTRVVDLEMLCFHKANFFVFVYVHDVLFHLLEGDYFKHPRLRYISNSEFTRKRLLQKYGLESMMIPPLVESADYVTKTCRKYVLFVNPNKEKGLDIAIKLAELNPDIPFLFLESWILDEKKIKVIKSKIACVNNINFMRATGEMRAIYSKTKLAIIPSRVEEAWGRIATEAHFNGIPVIASNIGGLPESVGPGGILIDNSKDDYLEQWNDALTTLWSDEKLYNFYSAEALRYSNRDEITPNYLIARLEEYLSR
ncbi:glycosyltransferase [Aestuariibacter salexigens]|uniref:glycosyltransferase n=1 Tax=Aestuariibacter salexigens TaxID=226010 RepID=UPI00040BA6C3|nr:glycosyltransferase [Aestuariibacter salexigens]